LIRSETKDRVARVRFDRIEKKNAITVEMYPLLGAALAAAEADPQVRAVLLHGAPDCFCAGNDVGDFLKRPPLAQGLPFVALGIVPEFGSTYLLPLIAGYQRAAKLLLLGQPFTAQEAQEAGIVTAVVSQESLLAEAEKAALALAALPPESIRLTKRLMKARQAETLGAVIDEETRIFTERLSSPEAKEALSAFLEKRKPDFSRF
jgi:enoyl-CoA hydratase/carnithine racemase